MSRAAVLDRDAGYVPSRESQQRIEAAKLRDIAFRIEGIVSGSSLSRYDIEMLAAIILGGFEQNLHVNKSYVYDALLKNGRTKHKAEILVTALFK